MAVVFQLQGLNEELIVWSALKTEAAIDTIAICYGIVIRWEPNAISEAKFELRILLQMLVRSDEHAMMEPWLRVLTQPLRAILYKM